MVGSYTDSQHHSHQQLSVGVGSGVGSGGVGVGGSGGVVGCSGVGLAGGGVDGAGLDGFGSLLEGEALSLGDALSESSSSSGSAVGDVLGEGDSVSEGSGGTVVPAVGGSGVLVPARPFSSGSCRCSATRSGSGSSFGRLRSPASTATPVSKAAATPAPITTRLRLARRSSRCEARFAFRRPPVGDAVAGVALRFRRRVRGPVASTGAVLAGVAVWDAAVGPLSVEGSPVAPPWSGSASYQEPSWCCVSHASGLGWPQPGHVSPPLRWR